MALEPPFARHGGCVFHSGLVFRPNSALTSKTVASQKWRRILREEESRWRRSNLRTLCIYIYLFYLYIIYIYLSFIYTIHIHIYINMISQVVRSPELWTHPHKSKRSFWNCLVGNGYVPFWRLTWMTSKGSMFFWWVLIPIAGSYIFVYTPES